MRLTSRLTSRTQTPDEPFDFSEFRDKVEAVLAKEHFAGEVDSITLIDLLQMLNLARRTVSVQLRQGEEKGELFFVDGDVVHAVAGEETGEKAFRTLVEWTSGRFSTESGRSSDERTVLVPFNALLLNAVRGIDEESREPELTSCATSNGESYEEGVAMNDESGPKGLRGPSDGSEVIPLHGADEQPGALEQLLSLSPELRTAAFADSSGDLLAESGEGDGRELCAVAAMSRDALAEAVQALGLGELEQYCVDGGNVALYVHVTESGLLALAGTSEKNPAELLEAISKQAKGGQS